VPELHGEEGTSVTLAMTFAHRRAKPKPKPTPRSPQLLPDVVLFDPDLEEWVMQLGVRVKTPNKKESRWAEKARKSAEKTAIWNTCLRQLGGIDRACIEHVQFVRFSSQALDKKDNLPASFKNVLDALCSWIWNGERVWQDGMVNYGKHDGWLEGTGKFSWDYSQKILTKPNHRTQGIQIRLRLSSESR
jgi:hypothetical protein